jgi:xylan 1,4-beta-xylosidase
MTKIQNPILPGFNPDPSILRVGDDYYIATSTFEWFPGVQIHHSKDLVNWKLITHPLTRTSQLDMLGNMPSCGIWAPCLSYCDGLFYLIYTNTRIYYSNHKDCHNYLVTAKDIMGPWSEPIYLNSSGFDPSLFHDDDGKKWLANMLWDTAGTIIISQA